MKIKGVDVSSYQGRIDWMKAKKAGVDFSILKVIRRNLKPDNQFENNWTGCVEAGVPIQGVYNYTYATTAAKAAEDARAVLKTLGPDRHPFVWLDYEDKSLPTGKRAAEIINAYGDVITAGGCRFGVYFGMSYYNSYLDHVMDFVRPEYRNGWEARYYNGYKRSMDIREPVNFDGDLYGWQYTSMGRVDGIEGYVDLDEWYVDIEAQATAPEEPAGSYIEEGFRQELAVAVGMPAEASAAEVLARTVTISSKVNRYHAAVTPLERLLKEYGYYSGAVEADCGKRPNFGAGMAKATKLFQSQITGLKNPDAEWTKRNKSYKKALGVN